jgi:hypothetical protein
LEEILVDVGNSSRVGVDARLAAAEPRVSGPFRTWQALGQTWLQDAVSLANTLLAFVIARVMQRMRYAPHEGPLARRGSPRLYRFGKCRLAVRICSSIR